MGIRGCRAPKEEWRILEGMHEPIVSRELFDKVQDIFEQNRKITKEKYEANAKNREGVENRFKGKIICADCEKMMRYAEDIPKNGKKCMERMSAADISIPMGRNAHVTIFTQRMWKRLCTR